MSSRLGADGPTGPPAAKGTTRTDDQRRIRIIEAAVHDVRPPALEHVRLRLVLNDTNTAGARRHLGRYRLAVGRPLVDALEGRPALRAYIAHEMGHLLDRRLNLALVPCIAAALSGAACILWETGTLAGPRWLAYPSLYAVVALVIAMTAIMRRSEYRADRTAVELTSLSETRAMLEYLATLPEPPGWQRLIATHPRAQQRIDRLSGSLAGAD